MFSNTSSGLLRIRSKAVLRTRPWLSGFVHRRRWRLTAWHRVSIFCRTKRKGDRLMPAFRVGIAGHETTTQRSAEPPFKNGWGFSARTREELLILFTLCCVVLYFHCGYPRTYYPLDTTG